ncbi:MAG: dihydrolipoyl dehydrogenase, partial [Nitrosomonas sp.]
MTQVIEIKIPDIGDFKDVPVIEVLVAPGDKVEKETSLITLETEKASLEVPAPQAGVVQDIKVKVGDKVSEGTVILTLAATEQSTEATRPKTTSAAPETAPSAPVTATPVASTQSVTPSDMHADVVVLGAGPG